MRSAVLMCLANVFVLTSSIARAEEAGASQKQICREGMKLVFELEIHQCGKDSFRARHECVPEKGDPSIVEIAPRVLDGVPLIIRLPPTDIDHLRTPDPDRKWILHGACYRDDQCGFHGYCDCTRSEYTPRGHCEYDPATYRKRVEGLRRSVRACKKGIECEEPRYRLRRLEERDKTIKPMAQDPHRAARSAPDDR